MVVATEADHADKGLMINGMGVSSLDFPRDDFVGWG